MLKGHGQARAAILFPPGLRQVHPNNNYSTAGIVRHGEGIRDRWNTPKRSSIVLITFSYNVYFGLSLVKYWTVHLKGAAFQKKRC